MLLNLHVENYALIEKLNLDLRQGLTVITGETGAGKSILLGALGLVLGQRADSKVIQEGREKCISEAVFDVRAYGLEAFFKENDLEYDPNTCIIRRELFVSGKSRAFVNDSPVSLSVLKDLSSKLMDIHSQHQNLLLGTDAFQLSVVDAIAANSNLQTEYKLSFTRMKAFQAELKTLEYDYKLATEEEEFLRFQYDQLDAAALKEGETETLEEEFRMLSHAEEIKLGLGRIYSLLDEEEGIVPNLKNALTQAESIQKMYNHMGDVPERLRTSYIDLKDLIRDVESMFNDMDVNPSRMEEINERMSHLFTLQQKHKVRTTDELIEIRENLKAKLQSLESSDDRIQAVRQQLNEATLQTNELATALSASRKAVFAKMESELKSRMSPLGMPKATFRISWQVKESDVTGQDDIEFLFSANGEANLQPINRIASGGEISRIMLCIKYLIAESLSLPTLLFDEIDTGISGEIAHKMGEIMRKMASRRQIICITHLPQIAALGNQHFKVRKTDTNGKVQTTVDFLGSDERLKEIAQMLSGANLTEAALQNARQLLLENNQNN
jgi:DNA repair protein RecN (Recombination protein N)